ncbi:PIN domain-like protein [Mycena olivaceomarginata]|nr:PIN domain-like protein [Mycena olivaceomarginata]
MGVLGLTPFLQKALQVPSYTFPRSPEVVKQLPDRLRGFAGKKIVIDGTLITQRLHFAPTPHNYRHVMGWYNLVKELQDSGVEAICVFDGKERSAAKARESGRRREAKELAVARGSIELDRVKRLQRLVDVLDRFQKFDPVQKGHVSELLRQISLEPNLAPALARFSQMDQGPEEVPLELVQPPQEPPVPVPPLDLGGQDITYPDPLVPSQEESSKSTPTYNASESTIEPPPDPQRPKPSPSLSKTRKPESVPLPSESLPREDELDRTPTPAPPVYSSQPSIPSPLPAAPPAQPPQPSTSLPPPAARSPSPPPSAPASPLERPFPSTPGTSCDVAAPAVDIDVLASLATLYFDFRESVQKLASLTPAPVLRDESQNTETEQLEARVAYSMTKGQIQLTTDEAKLWEELAVPNSPDELAPDREVEEKLAELSFRANEMAQSYERRNNPPTAQTYEESKELLRTMGVPCIDTAGTYEAEALAASLVINGEDTDVVIYEAPLIRNITNRHGPLMLLSGLEIRTAMELDRSSFIDFALLLGTDFSQRIKNVGPVRALKFIQQHKSIERVIEVEKKFTPRVPQQAYLAEVAVARMVFLTLPPVPDVKLLEQDKDDESLSVVLQRFGLGRLLMGDESFGFEESLAGNYFSDDPSAF